MMKLKGLIILWAILLHSLLFTWLSAAQAPMMINYQGRLLNGTNLYNGPANLTFRLFNVPTGGSALFVSTNVATVVDGLYATAIGQFVTLGSLDNALTNAQVWLEVVVNGTTLTPRERVLAVPYARAVHGLRVTAGHGIILNPVAGTNAVDSTARHATISGGSLNTIQSNALYATIGGGYFNSIQPYADYATIGGGHLNSIQTNAYSATIGGGVQNSIQPVAYYSTIGGGSLNAIQTNADYATIGGGVQNSIQPNADFATIGGGLQNTIQPNADYATIGGGFQNSIQTNADYATIPGGQLNSATNYAFAAGRRAKANHTGSFVWGDSTPSDVTSSASNQVTFRASGGFRIFSNPGMSTGVQVAANSGAWTSISDVNAKEGFEPVNPAEVLEKVVSLPITTWRYKGQSEEIRHMGPTAQDFYAAFGLGDLPGTGITSIDPDGVALAAIQALARENAEFRMQNAEIMRQNAELRAANEDLERKLIDLESRLSALEAQ